MAQDRCHALVRDGRLHLLSSLVLGVYLHVFGPHQPFRVIDRWVVYEWPVEALSWLTLVGILYLIVARPEP